MSAGIRTFAVACLAGAISLLVGGPILLAVVIAAIALMAAILVRAIPADDPGLTTEIALILTVLVGALAVRQPHLAAGIGVAVAILLAARSPLHHFVGSVLREGEVRDALIFAGATFVVLPLLPNRTMGPFAAFNPHAIWLVGVLVLAIGAAGHIAVRCLGPKAGLPLAGLASGFISSTATIGAMGARAAKLPQLRTAATVGAVLSTVATIAQLVAVIGVTSLPTLRSLTGALIGAGVAALGYGAVFMFRASRAAPQAESEGEAAAISVSGAVIFAATLAVVLVVSAALRAWLGGVGTVVAAAIAGLVDPHAAAISVAAHVAAGRMTAREAVLPILIALSTNTLSKLGLALVSGGRQFAFGVAPGLLLVAAGGWAGALLSWVVTGSSR